MGRRFSPRQIVTSLLGEGFARWLHARRWASRMPTLMPPAERALVRTVVRPGDVLLDIGAHGGSWSYWLGQQAGPNGRVHAIEAFPYYAATLVAALRRIRASNVTVHPIALGDEDGRAELAVVDEHGEALTGRIHLRARAEKPRQTVTIEIRKLDSLLAELPELARVRLAKVDVEGAELQVFRGGERWLAQARPWLYVEVVDEYCRRFGHGRVDVLDWMTAHGFTLWALRGVGIERVTRDADPPPHDYLFVPEEHASDAARLKLA